MSCHRLSDMIIAGGEWAGSYHETRVARLYSAWTASQFVPALACKSVSEWMSGVSE